MLTRCIVVLGVVSAVVSAPASSLANGLGVEASSASPSASPASFAAPPPGDALRATNAGATLIAGSILEVRWTVSPEALGGADEAELVLVLEGGPIRIVRLSSELSPRATSYRLRVPSIPATSARLALRVGSDCEGDHERLVVIGEPLAIASAPDAPDDFVRGPAEWWTEQALFERSVRDLLRESMDEEGERLVAPRGETEANRPSDVAEPGPPPASARIDLTASAASLFPSAPASAPAAVSSPLRL
ncbi:MAG TPA: hypothetical protein VH854_04100 [Thermoanaerobaculia bacterium]|nr:hypothetical protein [Thermoanaerobaculia bacterium]